MNARLPISLAFIWPLRLEYLSGWQALLLFAVLCVPIVLLGLRSLAGLGPVRRWVAMGMRILVILMLVLIVGGARWQRENKIVEVIVLRDISESTSNVHDYPDSTLQSSIEKYLQHVSDPNHKQADDRIQMIDKQTGKGLGIWGGPGREPGQFAYPWGVAVDKRGRVVAVDAANDRLQVFEF